MFQQQGNTISDLRQNRTHVQVFALWALLSVLIPVVLAQLVGDLLHALGQQMHMSNQWLFFPLHTCHHASNAACIHTHSWLSACCHMQLVMTALLVV